MPKKDPASQNIRYEVILQEDTESGDLMLPIPPEVLKSLGWVEGDDVDIDLRQDGSFTIKKVKK